MKNFIKTIFGKSSKDTNESKQDPRLEGLDEDTIALAKEIAFDKKMVAAAKNGRVKKADFAKIFFNPDETMASVFARTPEDSVLSNRFADRSGRVLPPMTLKRAVGMDGIRDLDDEVKVSSPHASPINPEGRFNYPRASERAGNSVMESDMTRRFKEAMNPREFAVVPSEILEHYAQFATFIGYPACELIASHPVVSNACNIPGEDAVAPGYKLQFVDSEDCDGDGIDDSEEGDYDGIKKVTESLEKERAVEALNDAIEHLSGKDIEDALNHLDVAIQRLAAYEHLYGDRDNSALIKKSENVLRGTSSRLREEHSAANKDSSIAALSVAIERLNGRDAVYSTVKKGVVKKGLLESLNTAIARLSETPQTDGAVVNDPAESLISLANAIDRLSMYENLSDRNQAICGEITVALKMMSIRCEAEERNNALTALCRGVAALDSGEFSLPEDDEPAVDGVSAPQPGTNQNGEVESNNPPSELPPQGDPSQLQQMADPNAMAAGGMPGMPGGVDPAEKQRAEEAKKKRVEAAKEAKRRQKILDQWKARADEMGMNSVCSGLIRDARIFGIGIAIPLVDGANYEEPFDVEKITHNSYHGFILVEPTWVYPEVDSNDLVNPLSPHFFEPEYWALNRTVANGSFQITRIHRSWMVIVRNKTLPDMLRPMYYYGGIPLTQEIYEAVYCADKLMNEAPKLAMCKRTTVVKGDPNDFITNPEGVVDRLRSRAQVQDNFGILYVGRNTDVMQLETSLSEFDQLIAKANQRIAAIAKMPETKLFKTQLAGMNSAGRYEWDDYSQLLMSFQTNWLTPLLLFHYKLDAKSQNDEALQIRISWNPIDVPTAAEKAENESRMVQTISSAIQAQMMTPDEGRIILRAREDSTFSSLPAENPATDPANQQQQDGGGAQGGAPGGMPGGMMGGMPGMMGGGDPMGGIEGGGDGNPAEGMSKTPQAGSPLDSPDEPKEPKPPADKK